MFDNSSIFVITTDNNIYRLEIDRDAQIAICDAFSSAVLAMTNGKSSVVFNGSYKPEGDEFLKIENFQLCDELKDAIRNPLGVTAFERKANEKIIDKNDFHRYPEIKTIFVGERTEVNDSEEFNIAFQRFRKEQNIVALPFCLFWSGNTFRQEKHFGIGITYAIDCFFTTGSLLFNSFYFARQVFDLSNYYRTATDREVSAFTENEELDFEDPETFKKSANSYLRRKIAMINDSGVLQQYSATKIKKLGKKIGIDIEVKDGKIVIPACKEDIFLIVGFLDEEAYRGPFSNNLLLANSKRIMKKG